MIEEKIKKRIEIKFEGIEESIKYVIEAQCELLSSLKSIQYLLFLVNSDKN